MHECKCVSESTGLQVSMCEFVCLLRVITNNAELSNVEPIHDQRKCKAICHWKIRQAKQLRTSPTQLKHAGDRAFSLTEGDHPF